MTAVQIGVVDHFGWAVVVTASADGTVVDRRRIELIEPGLPEAPIHHRGWQVHQYDAKNIEAAATQLVGADVLTRPRDVLGPPWTKDHRVALAAAILASNR
jgi:hypothetical protein